MNKKLLKSFKQKHIFASTSSHGVSHNYKIVLDYKYLRNMKKSFVAEKQHNSLNIISPLGYAIKVFSPFIRL